MSTPTDPPEFLSAIMQRIPVLQWAPQYNIELFRRDLVAGLTVGVVLIPQGVAYAMLAELPPVYGLYSSLVGLVVYAMLGTSKHISIGPFALVSLLVAETVSTVVPPEETARYVSAVTLLTLMVGCMHLLMAILKLDLIVAFLSEPVLSGFTSASAVLIASSQLKHLLGLAVPRGNLPSMIHYIITHLHQVNPYALLLGVGGVVLLDVFKKANKKYCPKLPLPEQLFVLIVAGGIGALLSPEQIALVGHVPSGLPPFQPPPITDLSLVTDLLQPTATVGLFAYILAMSIVRTMALKFEYTTNANQELVAFGLANAVGSFFCAYPAAGSLSRSSLVANACGRECTPLHGVWTAGVVFLVLVALTPAFRTLPYAVLASIVFMSVKSLFDMEKPRQLRRLNPPDFWLWAIAFASTLLLGTQQGIVLSIVCSLIALVAASMRPPQRLLGRLPGTQMYGDVLLHPEAKQHTGVAIFSFVAALHFANKDFFHDSLFAAFAEAARLQEKEVAAAPAEEEGVQEEAASPEASTKAGIRVVVLDFSSVPSMDATALRTLLDVRKELKERDVDLVMCGIDGQLKEILNRAKFFDSTGLDKVFAEVTQAAKAAAELAGGEGGGKKNKWAGLSMGNVHARKGLSGAAAML